MKRNPYLPTLDNSDTDIKLRKVALSDAKALLPLIKELGYDITEESLSARIALYQSSQNDIAWVAARGEEILGCVALHLFDLFHSNERFARIVSLVIKKEHRRQGLGKRLIRKAESVAKKRNCAALELTSNVKRSKHGVPHFYEQLGYSNEGEAASYYFRKYLKPKEIPFI